MSDKDALYYIMELKKFNASGELLTPKSTSKGGDPVYDCALYHAIQALAERIEKNV